ncbi:lysis protein [Pseudomonas sp. SG-MS2]|uniref:lysis system i-spanin subunit Rz n=1 Tax=Pseudomonas sp. SG-MS2 TaxID=1914534 RepID=UPI0013796535|nr:lysis system i-spanin subunit Rz [Pseudomonas sp. SG-MS2]KAF1310402.1 lysis protein [Pseudomonas sp. SG-MS2]
MTAWGARLIALAALVIACALGARAAWVWQDNAYGKLLADQATDYGQQLADKERAHAREREDAATAALDQLAVQHTARRDLEARLKTQGQAHSKEMNDAQQTQARLRDRLATADLRLSVLLDAGSVAAQGCNGGVREASSPGGVVHGAVRAQLDRAHAQRIVAITDEGDRGLIALQACQAYVREVTK